MKNLLVTGAVALAFAGSPAIAQEFVPPSDMDGQVYTTGANDGYALGRGAVFAPTDDFSLFSVGIFQDLTAVNLTYTLSLATGETGNVGGGPVLSSGSALTTTNGLEWVDFTFDPITLDANTFYLLEFSFGGNSNQNFFFNQSGAEPYSQPGFFGIDGTQGGDTANFVIPYIRLNGGAEVNGAVPEPATWALLLLGFFGIGGMMRRRGEVQSTTVTFA